MPSRLLFRFLVAVGLCVGFGVACGSSSDDSATTTSAVGDTPVSSTSTSAPASQAAISVAVYWNRPYGTARPIDIPGYEDPVDGPYPYVMYGSVTNVGEQAITQPRLTIDWHRDGQSIHVATVPARDAQGGTLGELPSGSSSDFITVVESEAVASRLSEAQPSFELYTP